MDLVVVGKRGLSPLASVFIGSVSAFVTKNASCAVLVYDAKQESGQVIASAKTAKEAEGSGGGEGPKEI